MPTDPKSLTQTELVRFLNSTLLGAVIDMRGIYQHRMQAGYRLGSGKHVDLFRYSAWVTWQRHRPKAPTDTPEETRAKDAARKREDAEAVRDIGEMPAVLDPIRKAKARLNFRLFAQNYFQNTFVLPFSPDHIKVIRKVETAVIEGGLFAMAMPRGSGKTSIVEAAGLWAAMYGHREFVLLIGATEPAAEQLLESIKTMIDSNPLLLADFPEVCFPIRALEGIANRCGGQLHRGERTHITFTDKEIVLPTIKDSPASGAIIKVAGLTGRIRGLKFMRQDGTASRPSLVILDDIQTDESAHSLSQCATRARLLAGAVLGLAGPKKKISGLLPCTVIRGGDVADVILDRKRHPEWNGERTQMVYRFPVEEKLWARYAEIRADSFRQWGDMRDATTFYRAHRESMDEGAEIAWPENFEPDELSGIQHAMNIRLTDEAAFQAEYQNEPLADKGLGEEGQMTADQIAMKVNGMRRGQVPVGCDYVTAFVDVQGRLLYWIVCAWSQDFTGVILDYGAYPDQKRPYFSLRDAQRTLQKAAPGAGLEGAIYAGLDALTKDILARTWKRDDGAEMRLGFCLVDANWGASTDTVYLFCQQSPHAVQLMPSHGRYVGAGSLPFSQYTKKPGDRMGLAWRVPGVQGKRTVRHVLYDTNFWKSFVSARLAVRMGDAGCLSLFGKKPDDHTLLAEHLTAEYRVKTEGRERVVDEWKQRPDRPDNHWLDGLAGAAAAASMVGAQLADMQRIAPPRVRRVVNLAEVRARRGF